LALIGKFSPLAVLLAGAGMVIIFGCFAALNASANRLS
jgi:hypothetical protein